MSTALSFTFDRIQWLKNRGFLEKKFLYMDLNFWIWLVEGTTNKHIKIRKTISKLVKQDKLVCPVSPTLLLEIKKQEDLKKRKQRCELMDQFSKGLSLRNFAIIFAEEFREVTEKEMIPREIAFSHFMEAFGVAMHFDFPEGWSTKDAERATELIFEHIEKTPISAIFSIEVSEDDPASILSLRKDLEEVYKSEKEWRDQNQTSINEIEAAERSSLVSAYVRFIAHSLLGMNRISLLKLNEMSDNERSQLLNSCPSFWCSYKLRAALRSNRRNGIKENDLWDLHHVASSIPYVDSVACDNGTRHLCTEMLEVEQKYGTKVISKDTELLAWLEKI